MAVEDEGESQRVGVRGIDVARDQRVRARDRYGAARAARERRRGEIERTGKEAKRKTNGEMEGVRVGTRETGLQETPARNSEHSTVSEAVSFTKIALDG